MPCAVEKDKCLKTFNFSSKCDLDKLKDIIIDHLDIAPKNVRQGIQYRVIVGEKESKSRMVFAIEDETQFEIFIERMRKKCVPPATANGKASTKPLPEVMAIFEPFGVQPPLDAPVGQANTSSKKVRTITKLIKYSL